MQHPPLEPALKFNPKPYHPNDAGNNLLQFRERGFAVLGNVFDPDSVDAYREQLRSLITEDGPPGRPLQMDLEDPLVLHPARAPRLLQVLQDAFMPWIAPQQPVLFRPGWLVNVANPAARTVHDWHKDGDHFGQTTISGYTYPQMIHTAIYLEDMTPEMGPTYVIPRSHRDPSISPYAGATEAPFLPGKADIVIWDQRLWHRGSARTVPGMRIVGIFSFMATPVIGPPVHLTGAQSRALESATTDEERILFGGPFFRG